MACKQWPLPTLRTNPIRAVYYGQQVAAATMRMQPMTTAGHPSQSKLHYSTTKDGMATTPRIAELMSKCAALMGSGGAGAGRQDFRLCKTPFRPELV